MKSKKAQRKKNAKASTQASLPIAEIKDGVVVLKDGTMRAVIMVSSINFALKSEDEQNAVISSYVGFLNSIDFPIQVVVQSRKLQIQPYLDSLFETEKQQTNELLRVQIADYRAFVAELVQMGQIMTKRYYVVVPYDPASDKRKGFWTRLKEVVKPAISLKLKDDRFRKRKEGLDMRIRHVSGGLQGIGLTIAQMDTQALIELYYSTYNPEIAFAEPMGNVNQLRVEKT